MAGGFDKTARLAKKREAEQRAAVASPVRLQAPFPWRAVPYDPRIFGSVPSSVLLSRAQAANDTAG